MNPWSLLADAVLLVHFAIVAFVAGGLVMIWAGYFRNWAWVRNGWFRIAHLTAMGIVLVESVFGVVCPLTEWENALRARAGQGPAYSATFVEYWVGRLLFYELSMTTFTILYGIFFALLLLSLWVVKPQWPRWKKR